MIRNQDGESHDLFWLFCTCIRTEWVGKLFITSLIFNDVVKCIYHDFVTSKQILKCFVFTCCSFLHNLKQKHSVFEVVWTKNTACMETPLRQQLATKSNEASALYHMKIH